MMRGDKTVSSIYGDKTCPFVLGIGRWKGGCCSEGKVNGCKFKSKEVLFSGDMQMYTYIYTHSSDAKSP